MADLGFVLDVVATIAKGISDLICKEETEVPKAVDKTDIFLEPIGEDPVCPKCGGTMTSEYNVWECDACGSCFDSEMNELDEEAMEDYILNRYPDSEELSYEVLYGTDK